MTRRAHATATIPVAARALAAMRALDAGLPSDPVRAAGAEARAALRATVLCALAALYGGGALSKRLESLLRRLREAADRDPAALLRRREALPRLCALLARGGQPLAPGPTAWSPHDRAVLDALTLLMRDGDAPIPYAARDIEQLGSAYEALLDDAPATRLRRSTERRRRGSHYTPRPLAEQVVGDALQPILAGLGPDPAPARILDLKVCDPAMGSGVFLLAACRTLGRALLAAWRRHGAPRLPRGVDAALHARRMVARHCLFGVDRDPIAAALARTSLRLLTRAGRRLAGRIDRALLCGDALVGARWEADFPAAFSRERPGFDAVIGNPPFAGKNAILAAHGEAYLEALLSLHPGAHGNADIVAHFFRRAFALVRSGGTVSFIATNTVAQGDTRATGLQWICDHGGHIYAARRRLPWPGRAAVVVSVVHVQRTPARPARPVLDGRPVRRISAFLEAEGPLAPPERLAENAGKSFIGSYVLGMGFTFDDTSEAATPLAVMRRLIDRHPRNAERIFPYLGGKEINTSPTQAHHRYVINFAQMTEAEARRWPDLWDLVAAKVRPQRARLGDNADGRRRRDFWWQWGRYTPALFEAVRGLPRVLVTARVSQHHAFVLVPAGKVLSEQLVVFVLPAWGAFAVLQSSAHEIWTRTFASSLEERRRYTPSDCFETFPFPAAWAEDAALSRLGEAYHAHRAALLVRRGEGLTAIYNRFHDPEERDPGVLKLRALHQAMDRAVLSAYGFKDLRIDFAFVPDGNNAASWRWRWPDGLRAAVLARLLALHADRLAPPGGWPPRPTSPDLHHRIS